MDHHLISFRVAAQRTIGVGIATVLAAAGITMLSSPWAGGTIRTTQNQTLKVLSPAGSTVSCSTAVAPAPALTDVGLHFATGLLEPFGVAFASDSSHVFVDSLFSPPRTSFGPPGDRDDSGISDYSLGTSGMTEQRVGTFPAGR